MDGLTNVLASCVLFLDISLCCEFGCLLFCLLLFLCVWGGGGRGFVGFFWGGFVVFICLFVCIRGDFFVFESVGRLYFFI